MKSEIRPKQKRQVEVKTLVPWLIILVIVVGFIGVVTGWTLRSDQLSQIKAEVAEQLKATATAQTPVKK